MRVIVVGAGVVGLSCAVRLAEAGYETAVVARDLPAETTSAVAAAVWYPYLAEPRDRVAAWSRSTYDEFVKLAAEQESVRLRDGAHYGLEAEGEPWWGDAVPDLRRATEPPAGFAAGWAFTSPVVEMPVYLPYLVARLEAAGGTLTRMALPALPNHAQVVVNCTGLGARLMAGDDTVRPVRGQVLTVEQPGITDWLVTDAPDALSYVIPRSRDVVVGGTSQPGDWNRTPDPATARAILDRATRLTPALDGAKVLAHKVGLRPVRSSIRCESVRTGDRLAVHCYGHGGSGVTVSWGCADEVLDLVRTHQP